MAAPGPYGYGGGGPQQPPGGGGPPGYYPPPPSYLSGPSGPVKMPGIVMAAAILWICYGGLGILGGLASMGYGGIMTYSRIIFAVAFLVTGIQTLMGKPSSLMGAGIACIILGALGILVMFGTMSYFFGGIFLMMALLSGGLLIVAGILALIGNQPYQQWRMQRGY